MSFFHSLGMAIKWHRVPSPCGESGRVGNYSPRLKSGGGVSGRLFSTLLILLDSSSAHSTAGPDIWPNTVMVRRTNVSHLDIKNSISNISISFLSHFFLFVFAFLKEAYLQGWHTEFSILKEAYEIFYFILCHRKYQLTWLPKKLWWRNNKRRQGRYVPITTPTSAKVLTV